MKTKLKADEKTIVSLEHITEDGKGVAHGPIGELILVDGVDETDNSVKVEIKKILEETIIAEKVSRAGTTSQATKKQGGSPYEMDEDDSEEYEDEDYGEEDEDYEEED